MCDVILTVAHHGSHGEPFHVGCSFFAVAVCYIVNCPFVVLLEYVDIENVLTDKFFVGNRGDEIFTVAEEDDNIVEVGAVGYEVVFFQAGTDETLFAVDV